MKIKIHYISFIYTKENKNQLQNIKMKPSAERSLKVESLCGFNEVDQMPKNVMIVLFDLIFPHFVTLHFTESSDFATSNSSSEIKSQLEVMPPTKTTEEQKTIHKANKENNANLVVNGSCQEDEETICTDKTKSPSSIQIEPAHGRENNKFETCCTLKPPVFSQNKGRLTNSKKHQSAKYVASLVRNPSILNVKPPQPLHHKLKLGVISGHSNSSVYVREPATPTTFVSMAEMMKKKSQLTLTIPKELELETSQCVCSVNVKSTAEFEEEIMAKIPKFKARPLNKKILEAPTLPALLRSNPQPPELQIETTVRATQNAELASVASTEVSYRKPHLTEPKTSLLHITLRARPPMVKSSLELKKEELEKIPKFKARPLNMKIFESKGEMGIFCNVRKQVTIPQEFHIAINERIQPSVAVADVFDK
ncbi:hypothetical protein P3X46_012339, partial [Hevea brasiliensis]